MRYVAVGLISFGLFTSAFAQDKQNQQNNESAAQGNAKNTESISDGAQKGNDVFNRTYDYVRETEAVDPYVLNNEVLEAEGEEEESKDQEKEKTESGSQKPSKKQCPIQSLMNNSPDGVFHLNVDENNEKLKVDRNELGEEVIKYKAEGEEYVYKKDKEGKSEYKYDFVSEDEKLSIIKNKDGSGTVNYTGSFDDLNNSEFFNSKSLGRGLDKECM